jgi:hypothetical protein
MGSIPIPMAIPIPKGPGALTRAPRLTRRGKIPLPDETGEAQVAGMALHRCFLPVACLSLAVTLNAAPDVWSVSANMNIFQVDAATNTETPFIPSPVISDSLAADFSGVLYVSSSAGTIQAVQGGPVWPTIYSQIADLYFVPGGLWGFSDASDTLFFFDLNTTTVTSSVNITSGLSGYTVTGVTRQASTGDFFLSANTGANADFLLKLDLSAFSASVVGAMSHTDTASYISDIEFLPDGSLLAMTWFHRHFLTVNPANGATTFLSAGPHRDANGLAVDPNPVPEAGTWAASLGLVGAATVMGWRRRSHAGLGI